MKVTVKEARIALNIVYTTTGGQESRLHNHWWSRQQATQPLVVKTAPTIEDREDFSNFGQFMGSGI